VARPRSRLSGVVVAGPLVPFVDAYRLELRARGYTARTAVTEVRQVARLSHWLDESELGVAELNVERVDEFLAFQRDLGHNRAEWSRPGLVCLLDVLMALGVLRSEEPLVPTPTEALLAAFGRHLVTERGLAAGTVRGYVDRTRRFLVGLDATGGLGSLTSAQVTAAVVREAGAVSVSGAQNFVASLRSFLRFCFAEGLVGVDLSQAALPVTGRRRSTLPWGITRAEAKALLASCDRRSALGRRDYALLITLLRLGLRQSEVAGLRLDDIDWRAAEVVVHGKGGRADRLPLPAEAGAAIAAYLRRGRPAGGRRELFLRARAPYGPIAPGTVASSVRRACRRAGIPEVGSHRLRHTIACEMVATGVPLVDIAQVLRHRSLQTTAGYARVDVERLRQLAAPWPQGRPR
jgi:integrase/recombinase XerD